MDFLTQVIEVIKNIGGVTTLLKISLVVTLLISSMKVTFLNDLIWSKLGAFKVYAAPILALIVGICSIGANGSPMSWALVFAYLTAGGGAVFLHEILDTIKAIPGLGPIYVTIINLISGLLGGKQEPVK